MPTLARHLTPEPPAKLDRSGIAFHPACWNNDTLPDCTAASLTESARGQAMALHGYDLPVALDAPRKFYAGCI
ncbi:MAG: hypothetical protein KGL39_50805, partial [Patescibacteria group bacterium]|nr:hypothetical protein [Patescibacteria group bacterium]